MEDGPAIRRLWARLVNTVTRGALIRTANGGKAQTVTVAGQRFRDHPPIEHWLPYGLDFIATPPAADGKGAEVIVLQLTPGHYVALPAMDRRARAQSGVTAAGDVAVYNAAGARVLLKANGDMEISAPGQVTATAGTVFRIAAPEVQIHADDKLSLDSGGYGEDWINDAGEYRVDTWKNGNVVPGAANDIAPPDHEGG